MRKELNLHWIFSVHNMSAISSFWRHVKKERQMPAVETCNLTNGLEGGGLGRA